MFIKFKLDSKTDQQADENNFKPSSTFFEVDDESTISEVKLQIEKYIDVPAECQEIRTLTQTLEDDEKLANIGELMRSTGCTIMLYTYIGDADKPIFYAFLQLYTPDEAAVQQDYERQLRKSVFDGKHQPASVASTVTLVNDSGSEDDDDVTEVNSSGSSSESSSGTDTDDSMETEKNVKEKSPELECRKRRISNSSDDNKKRRAKRYTVLSKISSNVNEYLEEFPRYTEKNNGIDTNISSSPSFVAPAQVSMATSTSDRRSLNDTLVAKEATTSQQESSSSQSAQPTASQLGPTTSHLDHSTPQIDQSQLNDSTSHQPELRIRRTLGSPSSTAENVEPCAFITPDRRAFITIFTHFDGTKPIDKAECIELLATFFDIFQGDENAAQLNFYGKSGPLLHNGLIWVPCQNANTMDWTLNKAKIVSDRHQALKFGDYFKLRNYKVVIPNVARNKDLFDVFNLIEQQNAGIKTTKWCVLERQNIRGNNEELSDKLVSCLCPNEMFTLGLDPETVKNLENNDFTLNYCFWKISFEPMAGY